MQSVPITTNVVVSSNSVHGEVYSIQHYVIKWFFLGTLVSSTNKTNCADITEMLLKVALSIITTSMSNGNAIQHSNPQTYFEKKQCKRSHWKNTETLSWVIPGWISTYKYIITFTFLLYFILLNTHIFKLHLYIVVGIDS